MVFLSVPAILQTMFYNQLQLFNTTIIVNHLQRLPVSHLSQKRRFIGHFDLRKINICVIKVNCEKKRTRDLRNKMYCCRMMFTQL